MSDLSTILHTALGRLGARPHPGPLLVRCGDGPLLGVEPERVGPLGPGLSGVVLQLATRQAVADGLLATSTTVAECVAAPARPAGIDPDHTVGELLEGAAVVGREAVHSVLGCMLAGLTGRGVDQAVRDLLHPARAASHPLAGPRLADVDGQLRWHATPLDLADLALAPTWSALPDVGTTGAHRPGPPGRQGVGDGDGWPALWRYPASDITVAGWEVAGVLAALDGALSTLLPAR